MIPKKFHYVWVGTAEKPDSVIKCIESWKKYCPDYEIIEWGNEEFEKIKNKYARQAFENKKWAFVSDYIRLYALYNHGGIYLDTDVEITQNIDRFLVHDFVSGFEKWKDIYSPVTAFMGAKQEHKIIKYLLEYYLTHEFETKDGLDMEPNTKRISNYFMKNFGLKKPYDGTKTIELCKNCMIYPYYYFCTPEEGKENFSIHHFNASWLDNYDRKKLFRLGNFRISRIKLRKGKNPDILPVLSSEKLIKIFKLNANKSIMITKKVR